MFAAVLDTCVLWPSLQRDFLLSLAIEGVYRPLWSEAILDELHHHEQQKLIDRGNEAGSAEVTADHLLDRMRTAFDDAIVTGWEALEGTFGLPDVDDEHVLAAAVVGGAGAVVTDNVKDFPTDRVPSSIQIVTARDFAADTVDVNPASAVRALKQLSSRHRLTPHTPAEILDLLVARYGMTDVNEILRPLLE